MYKIVIFNLPTIPRPAFYTLIQPLIGIIQGQVIQGEVQIHFSVQLAGQTQPAAIMFFGA